MPETTVSSDALAERASRLIAERLPRDWSVGLETPQGDEREADLAMIFRGPQASTAYALVEVNTRPPSPRDLRRLTSSPLLRRLRSHSNAHIILVAPYLSPSSRQFLSDENMSYADLTGNLRISLSYPGLFVLTEGASENPDPDQRRSQGLRGAKVGNILRALIDVRPPYSVTTLADEAHVSPGYVSRVLQMLEDEALIEREPRGSVTDVDWPSLLVRRAAELRLLASEYTRLYVARDGARATLDALGSQVQPEHAPVVTGSFAVERRVRIAAPALLVAYVKHSRERDRLARELDLIPADSGGDVALIAPANEVVADRSQTDDRGFLWPAESQLVIDCLSGPGRMPAEGEALIEWMRDHQDEWRRAGVADRRPAGTWRDDSG